MKVTLHLGKQTVKLLERLHATGLFGTTLAETAWYLVYQGLESKMARGGILHEAIDDPKRQR